MESSQFGKFSESLGLQQRKRKIRRLLPFARYASSLLDRDVFFFLCPVGSVDLVVFLDLSLSSVIVWLRICDLILVWFRVVLRDLCLSFHESRLSGMILRSVFFPYFHRDEWICPSFLLRGPNLTSSFCSVWLLFGLELCYPGVISCSFPRSLSLVSSNVWGIILRSVFFL